MQRLANAVKRLGELLVAGFLVIMPMTVAAQDLRGEIEAVVKDYLESHPDEVGEIVKGYFTRHPEVVGRSWPKCSSIAPRRLQRQRATAGAAPAATAAIDRAAAIARNAGSAVFLAAPGRAGQPRTATSPWSSSSTTVAATASARCPTCST